MVQKNVKWGNLYATLTVFKIWLAESNLIKKTFYLYLLPDIAKTAPDEKRIVQKAIQA